MKLLSADQIRQWDAATIAAQGVSSLELMERAASACTEWLTAHYSTETPFVIVCGTGNNGGDGLAITRQLLAKGYAAMAMLVRHTDALSPDCEANRERLAASAVQELRPGSFLSELPHEIIVIDALFGTGLNRPLAGYVADFISKLNELPNTKIAIDIPSGLPADGLPRKNAEILKATHTLTFQQYKRGMLHNEGGAFCGEVHLLDIGLTPDFLQEADAHWHTADKVEIRQRYRPRDPFSHKGTHGTAYIIGGSYGLIGAALLATQAAGRAGAGKVRALVPECGYGVIQGGAPEAMCRTSGERHLEAMEGWESAKGIGIGPGLGTEHATVMAYKAFLEKIDRPVVLDADALNILGEHPEWLQLVPKRSILTPHPKELERMFGKTDNSAARAELVREKAMEHELVIISKDRHTLTAFPDGRCFYNIYGNAGLATGGSGDVLCGILTGLLAQGYEPESAALLGVYLHAVAGDTAAAVTGMEALVAGDIVANIGRAYLTLA